MTYGGFFQNASSSGRAVYGLATATSGFNYGGYFQTASTSGRGLLGVAAASTGTTYGVYGTAVSPTGYGLYSDGNMHATGVISGNGAGLISVNAASLGGFSSSAFLQAVPVPLTLSGNSSTHIIRGENASTSLGAVAINGQSSAASGEVFGVLGQTQSPDGRGVVGFASGGAGINTGVYGRSDSPSGRGVFATAQATSGETYGVWGESNSTAGRGVFGTAQATSGVTYGVRGESNSTAGRGVFGEASATVGTTVGGQFLSASTFGIGVYGSAFASSGETYGVFGQTNSPDGWAVYAVGPIGASIKAFRIDHPFDPENKYLLHYASESPMPQNFYVGNVVTDAKGYAWVELPDYFAEINANFKYQLTVVDGPNTPADDFVQVKVRQEIKDRRFQVRTSAPNVKVSWRVDADRNDLYVQNRKPKDVVDKQGLEKGTYQHPELYGLGPERGMNYDPEREKQRSRPHFGLSAPSRSK